METESKRRPVRVVIDGEAYTPVTSPNVLIVVRGDGGKVVLPSPCVGVTVEDVAPPRVWTDGDVVQEVSTDRVLRRVASERGGGHFWSNGFLATRPDKLVSEQVADGRLRVLRYQAGDQ